MCNFSVLVSICVFKVKRRTKHVDSDYLKVLRESHRLIMTVSFLVQSGSDGSL